MSSLPGKCADGALPHHALRRWWWLGGAAAILAFAVGLGVLVQRATWAGPALANGLRAIVGDRAVARLEEAWAGVQDRALRRLRRHEPPRELKDALPESPPARLPARPTAASPAVAGPDASARPDAAPSRPESNVEAIPPPFPEVAAAHDGQWFPILDPWTPFRMAKAATTAPERIGSPITTTRPGFAVAPTRP